MVDRYFFSQTMKFLENHHRLYAVRSVRVQKLMVTFHYFYLPIFLVQFYPYLGGVYIFFNGSMILYFTCEEAGVSDRKYTQEAKKKYNKRCRLLWYHKKKRMQN